MNLFTAPLYKAGRIWQAEIDTENLQWREQGGLLGGAQQLSEWRASHDPIADAEAEFEIKLVDGYHTDIP